MPAVSLYVEHSETWASLYNGGYSLQDIAAQYNTYASTVRRVLHRKGVLSRLPGKRSPKTYVDITKRRRMVWDMTLAGYSASRIAWCLSASRHVINWDEQVLGIPSRKSKHFKSWLERMQGLRIPASNATSLHAGTVLPVDVSSLNSPRSQQGAAFFCSEGT